jgi:hypothetical protein
MKIRIELTRIATVGLAAILVSSCGAPAERPGMGSDDQSISTEKNSPRLLGITIDLATPSADGKSAGDAEVSCAYEWIPGTQPSELVNSLNKNSKAFSVPKDDSAALRKGAIAMSGAVVATLACAVITPCKVGRAVIAGSIGLGAFGAAVLDLQKVENRRKVWPAVLGQLDARWSPGDYQVAKSVLAASGNTDTLCKPVQADLLRQIEMASCKERKWTCPD